jgi:hypothetical protein
MSVVISPVSRQAVIIIQDKRAMHQKINFKGNRPSQSLNKMSEQLL